METSLASKVVQAVEFAGYGPVVATGPFSLKAQCLDKVFEINIRGIDGGIQDQKPFLKYQNPVDRTIQATMSLINYVYVDYGKMPSPGLDEINKVVFSNKLTIVVRYLWMNDPEKRTCQVLNELLIDGSPEWNSIGEMPYGAKEDSQFWDRTIELLTDFKANSKCNSLTSEELASAIAFCSGDDIEEKV